MPNLPSAIYRMIVIKMYLIRNNFGLIGLGRTFPCYYDTECALDCKVDIVCDHIDVDIAMLWVSIHNNFLRWQR